MRVNIEVNPSTIDKTVRDLLNDHAAMRQMPTGTPTTWEMKRQRAALRRMASDSFLSGRIEEAIQSANHAHDIAIAIAQAEKREFLERLSTNLARITGKGNGRIEVVDAMVER